MCGILFYRDPAAPPERARLERALAAMRARGPDRQDLWLGGDVALGHARLSIIDLSEAAAQPFRDRSGRFLLTYNGEIYNYAEIGRALAAEGIALRTRSDTEVLLEGLLHFGVGPRIDLSGDYLVVMQHPVTVEYEAARDQIQETLHAVSDCGAPALWFWPNVDAGSDGTSKGIRAFRETHALPNVHFFKNLPPEDFLRVVNRSRGIVGNSSVAIRECAYLGVPAVNIGTRQTGRERGRNVIDVGYDRLEILRAIERQLAAPRPAPDMLYGDGNAGARIAEGIAAAPLTIEKRLTY
jgi:hypothetical protein